MSTDRKTTSYDAHITNSDIDDCEPEYEVVFNEKRIFCHVRQLLEYARLKGVDSTELTPEEVAMFEYKE